MTAACPAQRGASVKGAFHLPTIVGKRSRAPRTAGGFSRPPFCRIAPDVEGWVLELEPGAERTWFGGQACIGRRKIFASLTAAIDYAVARGWRYRVVHAPPLPPIPIRRASQRSAPL
jgi:hypothetical protein